MKVTISLVTYNGQKYIPYLTSSLKEQTYKAWELIVLDNASSDDTVSALRDTKIPHKLLEQRSNIGFAAGHNRIISWSESDFVLVINQDIFLDKDFLKRAVEYLEDHPQIATIGGRLLHWNFDQHDLTNIVDSYGLTIDKRFHVEEYLHGHGDENLPSASVFGISGALALYRRRALEAVKLPRRNRQQFEYFDEDFFAYKEDIDLAWRLKLAGWENYRLSHAVAYHDRSLTKSKSGFADRRMRSSLNKLSYRNHLCMIRKNSSRAIFWRFFPHIFAYELAKFFFLLILDRSSLQGVYEYLKLRPRMSAKRKAIRAMTTVSTKEMLRWFT